MNKKLINIELVAEGGGQYDVYVDGIVVSSHNAFHKAVQKAVNEQVANPDAEVYFLQTLKVNLTSKFEEIPEDDVVIEEPTIESTSVGSFTTE